MITNIVEKEFLRSILAELGFETNIASKIVSRYFIFISNQNLLKTIMSPTCATEYIVIFMNAIQKIIECIIPNDDHLHGMKLKRAIDKVRARSVEWHGLDLTPEDLMAI